MAQAINARRKGDEYQALLFWHHLLKLRTGDVVESVTLESDRVSFVDDIVVKYNKPQCDRSTGKRFVWVYYQCKYHVTEGGAFRAKNLIEPDFIHCSESMLKRLYDAYVKLLNNKEDFCLYIVSNWNWDPGDELTKHVSDDKKIRDTFYENTRKSKRGKIRADFASHLSIDERLLKDFLETIRFDLGKKIDSIIEILNLHLAKAELKPIDTTKSTLFYDDLAWKLFEQRRNSFNCDSFNKMLKEEDLIIKPPANHSEISIFSYPQVYRRPHDIQVAHLDLSNLFEDRYPTSQNCWEEIPGRVIYFFENEKVKNLPNPVYLYFDCHLSIAFFTGYIKNLKFRNLKIIPMQKFSNSPDEAWIFPVQLNNKGQMWDEEPLNWLKITEKTLNQLPDDIKINLENLKDKIFSKKQLIYKFEELKIKDQIDRVINYCEVLDKIDEDLVIGISVTHPVQNELLPFLQSKGLNNLPVTILEPINGTGYTSITGGEHAWNLAHRLRKLLDNALLAGCNAIHFFYSGPVALAYIFGNMLYMVKNIQFYEHDFRKIRYTYNYYPSVKITSDIGL
jgi:hypothetical protein